MRRITWIGHATVLIEVSGTRLLTDPVLRNRVTHLKRHSATPDLPAPVDGVLVSHAHYDHLDRPSLRLLAKPGVTAVVPAGVTPLLKNLGFTTIHEVSAGETLRVGGADVRAVPAWHDGRRRPGTPQLGTLGFIAGGIWFAGDTDIDDDMSALRGQVDVALIPIWGWGPSLGPGHLDPEGAARAIAMVAPRVAIPIHWGTFLPLGLGKRHRGLLTDPPHKFAAHAAELAPETHVEILQPGGSLTL